MSYFVFRGSFLFHVLAIAMKTKACIGIEAIMRFVSEGINAKDGKKKYGA